MRSRDFGEATGKLSVKISEIDIKPFIASTGVVYEKLGYTELRKQVNAILGR